MHSPASSSSVSRKTWPRRSHRYWLEIEIPYRAFYAFEETLAVFGDTPGSPGSLLAALERITGAIGGSKSRRISR